MTTTTSYLFQEVTPELASLAHRPTLKSTFRIHQLDVTLALTPHYLFIFDQASHRHPTHYSPLSFDFKFEVVFQSLPECPSSSV